MPGKLVPKKQCSQLPENCSEEDFKIIDDDLLSVGESFKTLIDSSSSVQGHFQFKNEKLWTVTNKDEFKSSSIFQIDLGSVAENLSNIDFSERLGMSCGCFTGKYSPRRNEIRIEKGRQKTRMFNEYMTLAERMDELDARYAQLMKDKEIHEIIDEKEKSTSTISATSESTTLSNECDRTNNNVPTDVFSNMKTSQAQEPQEQKKDENNLEDWLDSMLDK